MLLSNKGGVFHCGERLRGHFAASLLSSVGWKRVEVVPTLENGCLQVRTLEYLSQLTPLCWSYFLADLMGDKLMFLMQAKDNLNFFKNDITFHYQRTWSRRLSNSIEELHETLAANGRPGTGPPEGTFVIDFCQTSRFPTNCSSRRSPVQALLESCSHPSRRVAICSLPCGSTVQEVSLLYTLIPVTDCFAK